MNSIKKRFYLPFALGVLVGILGSAAVVKLIDHDKKATLQTEKAYELKPEQNEPNYIGGKTGKKSTNNKDTKSSNKPEKITNKIEHNENEQEIDTTQLLTAIDSSANDSILHTIIPKDTTALVTNNEIIIKKEELLASIALELINIIPTTKAPENEKDSLIEKITGIKKMPTKKSYQVEYWESPLNYKGYKMANNKIVIYGLEPSNRATLYLFDKKIYLLHNGVCYNLDNTFAFKPFNQVKDETIIAQLTE